MKAGAAAFASALLLAAPAQAAPPPSAPPAGTLAGKLELAMRACAVQITRRGYLDAKNQAALTSAGIALGSPPPEVLTMATRLFGNNGIYASVRVPQGAIWIAASATVPACKVTLADTALATAAKMEWLAKLRTTSPWRQDTARSGPQGPIYRDFFVLNPERPGGHMILMVDGPTTIRNQGQGIQMIMTLGVESAKAP